MLYQKVTGGDSHEKVAYVFNDIPLLDSHRPYLFWKMLHLKLCVNMEELKHKVGLRVTKRIIIFDIVPHFN